MPQMITLKPHRYANAQRKVGERYEAKEGQELRLVRALKWAENAPALAPPPAPPAEAPKRTYTRRALEVEPAVTVSIPAPVVETVEEVKPKRTYTRRDLSAEE